MSSESKIVPGSQEGSAYKLFERFKIVQVNTTKDVPGGLQQHPRQTTTIHNPSILLVKSLTLGSKNLQAYWDEAHRLSSGSLVVIVLDAIGSSAHNAVHDLLGRPPSNPSLRRDYFVVAVEVTDARAASDSLDIKALFEDLAVFTGAVGVNMGEGIFGGRPLNNENKGVCLGSAKVIKISEGSVDKMGNRGKR